MTHEEIKILISAYTDGEATPSEKNIVEEHLKACASCQKDFKAYKAISSSLSNWPNETLSPDEEIKIQKSFEQRREPMFTKRSLSILGTALALTIIVGSVVQNYVKRGFHGGLRSAADDIGDQYSNGNTHGAMDASQSEPYYLASNYNKKATSMMLAGDLQNSYNKRLGNGLVSYEASLPMVREGFQQTVFGANAAPMAQARLRINADLSDSYPSSEAIVPEVDRKIIKNSEVSLKVKDAPKTEGLLENLVTRYNGTIANLTMAKQDDGSHNGQMTIKVQSNDFEGLLRDIRTLGEVQSENRTGSDVTNQYLYVQNRLKDQKIEDAHLHKLLNKNLNDVENNLNVQSQIDDVEANINGLENSLKQIDDQSYMGTITVDFFDTVELVKPIPQTFKDKLKMSLKDNLKTTLEVCSNIGMASLSGLFIILAFAVQVVIWSLIIWGAYLLFKKLSGK